MKKVLILTRTNWSEPPRIRHQITRLLKNKGYAVTYIEKNTYKSLFIKKRKEEDITFFSHAELLHHQLRYFPFIQRMNNFVVQWYLRRILKQVDFDFVMNFCYEYCFLKKLIPNKKIITMIEDDFEAQAKFGMKNAIKNQIKKTCQQSDYVLTVSYPLFNKLKTYKNNVVLFLPWSQRRYKAPKKTDKRDTVLYFGYVGRLDWDIVHKIIKTTSHKFKFIGPPIRKGDTKMIDFLKKNYNNFSYVPYKVFNELDVSKVFCSILPYNTNLGNVQACTVSNRAFNLLSLGLPLVYADLKNIIKAPKQVISTNKDLEEYTESLDFFHSNFYECQQHIESFLKDHYKELRWEILNRLIND